VGEALWDICTAKWGRDVQLKMFLIYVKRGIRILAKRSLRLRLSRRLVGFR